MSSTSLPSSTREGEIRSPVLRGKTASPRGLLDVVAILICLSPLAYCLLRGSTNASLWLDELLYYNFERYPEVRAVDLGRPDSLWTRLLGNFAYCDLQRGIHAGFDALGLHLWMNPELYLRLPSLLFFGISIVALYLYAIRRGGGRVWAAGVALAFGSTPIFLFYAFEARVYSLAALLVLAFLAVLVAVVEGGGGRVWIAGAILGGILTWAHLWNAPLVLGLAFCVPLLIWRDPGHWKQGIRVLGLTALGTAVVLIQATLIFSTRIPGVRGIPLLEPQPMRSVFFATIYGPFLGLLRGYPEYLLGLLLAISFFRIRSRSSWVLPATVLLSLAISVLLMAKIGLGVSPRHQTGLFAGVFLCVALMRPAWVTKAVLAVLIGVNMFLVPRTAERIEWKGNSKQIAQAIASREDLRRIPVVVQHSYSLGYADPLHTFGLSLYLDQLKPGVSSTPILELPTHRDVRDLKIERDYFWNATDQLDFFTRAPTEEWVAYLRKLPQDALWFVAPAGQLNIIQQRKYEETLKAAGFSRIEATVQEFEGYPTTKLSLWKRPPVQR